MPVYISWLYYVFMNVYKGVLKNIIKDINNDHCKDVHVTKMLQEWVNVGSCLINRILKK